jgi:GNAT superfamily N-acetyltransferase
VSETFVRMAAPADRPAIERINNLIYALELGQQRPSGDGRLADAMGDRARYVVAERGGEVVGMLALTLPGARFSLEASLADAAPIDAVRDRAVEVRRLAVLPEHRRQQVFAGMVRFVRRWCLERGLSCAFISGLEANVPMYQALGFVPFGAPFTKGAARYQPMVLDAAGA